jgi:excisionase family DNA binding protein
MSTNAVTIDEGLAPVESPLYKSPQAAEYLGVSERTVWGLRAKGELSTVRIGRLVFLSKAELDDFIERHRELARN